MTDIVGSGGRKSPTYLLSVVPATACYTLFFASRLSQARRVQILLAATRPSKSMSLEKEHANLRSFLLGLPEVRLGSKFGEEAFFVDKRFFCHFHRGSMLLLEAFVWDKVAEVIKTIPGVVPHPQYGAYGWVRLKIHSPADTDRAKRLIESSYRYVVGTKRISLPKTQHCTRAVEKATEDFPNIRFKAKPTSKRIQVIMEVRNFRDSTEARQQLNQAANYLRKP